MDENFFNRELNKRLEKDLEKEFKLSNGTSLNSVTSRVFNNRNLNLWMISYLPENSGLSLGKTSFWDDIIVDVHYGLSVDFKNTPRKVGLFVGESVLSPKISLEGIYPSFPNYSDKYNFRGWPSASEFVEKVHNLFSDEKISRYLINFEKPKFPIVL